MRRDTRFARPDRATLETQLPPGTLSDAQALGVWSLMLQSDDPSEVSFRYRSYRDSPHCSVPRETLRSMRDVMINGMRAANKQDETPRKEKKVGVHYDGFNDGFTRPRSGA